MLDYNKLVVLTTEKPPSLPHYTSIMTAEFIPDIPRTTLLSGKVAVVTGGSRGIGRAVAETFAYHGARAVVINSRAPSSAHAEEVVANIALYGARGLWVPGDIGDSAVAKSIVAQTIEQFGGLDILVNNAGITRDALMVRLKPEDFTNVLRTNFMGAHYITAEAVRHMMRRRDGVVVFISSIAAHGNPGQANYAASKGAVESYMKSLAAEYGGRGLRFNAVAPALVETDIIAPMSQEVREALIRQSPLGRIITPPEIAGVVLCVASGAMRVVNGQVINADGGMIR